MLFKKKKKGIVGIIIILVFIKNLIYFITTIT